MTYMFVKQSPNAASIFFYGSCNLDMNVLNNLNQQYKQCFYLM